MEEFYAARPKGFHGSKKNWRDDDDDEPPIWIEHFEEQVGLDLTAIENLLIDIDPASNTLRVRADAIMPLTAVIVDALVRYDYDPPTVSPICSILWVY